MDLLTGLTERNGTTRNARKEVDLEWTLHKGYSVDH